MEYEVTIGIPVYNVEEYIRSTLESALAQTFSSIEILICDDCATDGSVDIIRSYQQTHPRGRDIRILHHSRNMGVGPSRNRLIQEARGHYLFFMDADDLIETDTIETLMTAMEEQQADVVYGSYISSLCYVLQVNSFYIVCFVLKFWHQIEPRMSYRKLRQIMHHPMSLWYILHFRYQRASNLLLWLIGNLPTPLLILTVSMIRIIKKK